MGIVEALSWRLGPFTVQQRPRFDSPGWPQYLVLVGDRLIGKQFSIPSLSDCLWLEHSAGVYATPRPRPFGYTAQKQKRQRGITVKEPEPLS